MRRCWRDWRGLKWDDSLLLCFSFFFLFLSLLFSSSFLLLKMKCRISADPDPAYWHAALAYHFRGPCYDMI